MILRKFPLDFQWQTPEPFLFCVHHLDFYPKGTPNFGPSPELLTGRELGQDFISKDGFRMYHGQVVPGFPVHPHRGFETITIVRRGFVDHADSIGAAGRYGEGDVQWMTAGKGVQHSEMFPLLNQTSENTLELFQIWLNLPASRKMSDPDFKMFWKENIPVIESKDKKSRVTLIAGKLGGITPPGPPSASWAYDPDNETAIWIIEIQPDGEFEIPSATQEISRGLYFYDGDELEVGHERVLSKTGLLVESTKSLRLRARKQAASLLLLQSKKMNEPVVQYGPFVMNSKEQIQQTFQEYHRTHFGGWAWNRSDMIHASEAGRFAKYPDGHIEKPRI